MYFVYGIYNSFAKKLYIGQTQNLNTRLVAHNEKCKTKSYTSRFEGEWELIYRESFTTRSEAINREKQLKSHQGREFLKQYIPG